MDGSRQPTKILLASGSPRRKALMALTGWQINTQPVSIDETPAAAEEPLAVARRLALSKAEAARKGQKGLDWVLAADTIVVDGGKILGKPLDPDDAQDMLLQLAGRTHTVITALALVDRRSAKNWVDACQTRVPMRSYPVEEVEEYIASGSPLDKAGAYGIQDSGFNPVRLDRMQGCFANVMGLPLCHLTRMLTKLGFSSKVDIPAVCQQYTNFNCEAYMSILG